MSCAWRGGIVRAVIHCEEPDTPTSTRQCRRLAVPDGELRRREGPTAAAPRAGNWSTHTGLTARTGGAPPAPAPSTPSADGPPDPLSSHRRRHCAASDNAGSSAPSRQPPTVSAPDWTRRLRPQRRPIRLFRPTPGDLLPAHHPPDEGDGSQPDHPPRAPSSSTAADTARVRSSTPRWWTRRQGFKARRRSRVGFSPVPERNLLERHRRLRNHSRRGTSDSPLTPGAIGRRVEVRNGPRAGDGRLCLRDRCTTCSPGGRASCRFRRYGATPARRAAGLVKPGRCGWPTGSRGGAAGRRRPDDPGGRLGKGTQPGAPGPDLHGLRPRHRCVVIQVSPDHDGGIAGFASAARPPVSPSRLASPPHHLQPFRSDLAERTDPHHGACDCADRRHRRRRRPGSAGHG